jgi:hypothetical protein
MERRDVILCSLALFLWLSLTESLCSGSRKCQVHTTHSTEKHKIELDVDCMLFLIDNLKPRLFLQKIAACFLVYFPKTFKTEQKKCNRINYVFCCSLQFLFNPFWVKLNTWRVNGTCAQKLWCVFMLSGLGICPGLTEDRPGERVLLYIIFQVLTASVHQMMTFAFLHHAVVNGSGISYRTLMLKFCK